MIGDVNYSLVIILIGFLALSFVVFKLLMDWYF